VCYYELLHCSYDGIASFLYKIKWADRPTNEAAALLKWVAACVFLFANCPFGQTAAPANFKM
jgi:hypothetical protein